LPIYIDELRLIFVQAEKEAQKIVQKGKPVQALRENHILIRYTARECMHCQKYH